MMRKFGGFSFTGLLLFFFLSCGGHAVNIAKVGDDYLNEKQFQLFRELHRQDNTMDDFIRREIAFRLAGSRGLLDSDVFSEAARSAGDETLKDLFIGRTAKAAEFSEKDAREFYFRHQEKALCSHILFKAGDEAALAKLRISGGEKFEAVAAELSIDDTTKEKGGDLGWISKGMTVQPFEEALFSGNKGDLLGPVRTEYGYHLILVRDVKAPSADEFEKKKDAILEAMAQSRLKLEKENILKPLREKYPLKGDDGVLNLDKTTEVFEGDESRIAGRVAEFDISLKDVKLFMAEVLKVRGGGHSLGASTKMTFMEAMADEFRILKAAREEGLDKSTEFTLRRDDAVKDKACEAYRESFLKTFSPSESDLEKFYRQNLELFRELSSVRLHIIVSDNPDDAQKAVLESKTQDFSSLYEKYADKEATGDMDTGMIDISSLAKFFPREAIEQIAGAQDGEVVGPFGFQDGFVVMKLIEKRFADSPSFEHSRDRVRAEFLKRNGEEAFRNYLDTEGRKAVKVEIISPR